MLKIDDKLVEMAGNILESRSTEESPMRQGIFIKCLQFTLAISHDEAVELFNNLIESKLVRSEWYTHETDPYLKRKVIATPELDALIGLTSVKKEIRLMSNMAWMQKKRQDAGLKTTDFAHHMVFSGNPGTGKTTVARIVGKYYKELGILSSGHLVETDRSGLVAQFIGHTEEKVNAIVDKALDGVLFIDEAYALSKPTNSNDFGAEAIATLIKRMEDDRDRLVVILAGYSDEMAVFMKANPGMKSRIGRYIEFPDYSVSELSNLFVDFAKCNDYIMGPGTFQALYEIVKKAVGHKDGRSFGNGRYVRNLFERAIENQACRLCGDNSITKEQMATILPCDIMG